MNVLITLIFIALAGFQAFVAVNLIPASFSKIKSGHGNSKIYVTSYVSFIISLIEFWLLTKVFLGWLFLGLLLASVVSTFVYLIMGAISGIILQEKQKKIGALTVIWAMIWSTQNAALGSISDKIKNLVYLSSIVGSLWVFWSNPIIDANAKLEIAFLLIVLPQLALSIMNSFTMWPVVTSEYLDDDVRKSSLITSFSTALLNTAFLLFPIWLFHEGAPALRFLIPFLLAAPLIIFIIGGLIPFFVGIRLHRTQTRINLKWEEDWLNQACQIECLPSGYARDEAIDTLLIKLSVEFHKIEYEKNQFDQPYVNLYNQLVASMGQNLPSPSLANPDASSANSNASYSTPPSIELPSPQATPSFKSRFSDFMAKSIISPEVDIMRENYDNLAGC